MDNLPAHKGPRVEKLIKAVGAELRYLPPYSPDMNPIEKAFSKLKAYLRKIAEPTVQASCAPSKPAPISSNPPNAQTMWPWNENLKIEAPEAAAQLENLTFDCRQLPEAIKAHSIWKLDRAILRTLPGANFIE